MQHVFILGAGRSGTKILRDCLGSAAGVTCIPYDVGYVWRYGNESIPHDEILPTDVTEKERVIIGKTIDKLAAKAANGKEFSVVLEKSVPNTLRPLVLKAIFPDAKLIHMVRDGRNVIESSMRNWKNPSDTGYFLDKLRYFPVRNVPYAIWYAKNKLLPSRTNNARLWGPRYAGMQDDANSMELLEVCTRQWIKCVDICDKQLAEVSPSDVMEIKYEDFVSEFDSVLDLCAFAGIDDVAGVEKFYRGKVRADLSENNVFSSLPSEQLGYINEVASTTLARHGYV